MHKAESTTAASIAVAEAPEPAVDRQAPHELVRGASMLAVSTVTERGLGFLANFLAARIGGPATYGAYMLALTTANTVAVYAGSGIGNTANRFSAEHSPDTPAYRALLQALTRMALASALLATVASLATASILARYLLQNDTLAGLLRWAAPAAGVMVLLECGRGFLMGQRRYRLLLAMAIVSGGSWLVLLPVAAGLGPVPMVLVYTGAALAATVVCLWRTPRGNKQAVAEVGQLSLTGQVWKFGLVQLGSIIGLNAAGWWVASLVAQSDHTLAQVGFFAIANQCRNMVALLPGLFTQGSYKWLTVGAGKDERSPEHMTGVCTFLATMTALLLAGPFLLLLPVVLRLAYGAAFAAAVIPVALALTTAIVHMGGAPAAARLTIVSFPATGVINAVWTIAVVVSAAVWVREGGAAAAAAIYLATHILSALLVPLALRQKRSLPPGLLLFTVLTAAGATALAIEIAWRAVQPHGLGHTLALPLTFLTTLAALTAVAWRYGWLVPEVRR